MDLSLATRGILCYTDLYRIEKENHFNMPNIKSAKKRVLVTAVKNLQNKMAVSALRTDLKKFDAAVAAGNKAEATELYKKAVVALDKAAAAGLIHKNNAANKKSKLTIRLNAMA